jgi:ferrochelatase
LLKFSRRLTQHVRERLKTAPDVEVALAMRYGEPGIAPALLELSRTKPERLIVLPLYPQYSGTTTASVIDAVTARLPLSGWNPQVTFVERYHDDPRYIAALAESVRAHWLVQGRGDHLLMSFHGIPEKNVADGDPYARQCHETARLLARALELDQKGWSVAFQSRLGRAPWIKPYTDHELGRFAQAGVRTLDVICPGFPADCLETLEEVAIRYEAQFRALGGAALRYIPALNDSPAHVDALAGIIEDRLKAD